MTASRVPAEDRRLPSLTGLRFIAAFIVFGFHVAAAETVTNPAGAPEPLHLFFRQGATGVSFFFILSGFVLCWSARPGDTVRRFWRRRAAKVYPNHFVTALVALAIVTVTGAAVSALAIAANFLLLQAWIPREQVFFGLNTPSWSLSCEAFFYLCFPLLLAAVDRLPRRWLWPGAWATMALVLLVPVAALALPEHLRYWFVYVFPPVRMLEFVIGILLARIVQNGLWIRLTPVPAAGIALAAYLLSGFLPLGFSWVAGTVVPLALLIPAVATSDLRGGRSILRTRTMIWLGEISFAFYLVHQLAIRTVDRALGSWNEMLLALVSLALALAASWALYRVVERPMMARLAGSRRKPATALAAAG